MAKEKAAYRKLSAKLRKKGVKCPKEPVDPNNPAAKLCQKRIQKLIEYMPQEVFDDLSPDERIAFRKRKYGKNGKKIMIKIVPRGAVPCPRWCGKGRKVRVRLKNGTYKYVYKLTKSNKLCKFMQNRCNDSLKTGRYVYSDY